MTKHKISAVKYYLNNAIKKYFQHAYGMNEKIEFIRKPSTRKRKLKIYK